MCISHFLPQNNKSKAKWDDGAERNSKKCCPNFAAENIIPTAGNSDIFIYHVKQSNCSVGLYLCRRAEAYQMSFLVDKHALPANIYLYLLHRKPEQESAASTTDIHIISFQLAFQ